MAVACNARRQSADFLQSGGYLVPGRAAARVFGIDSVSRVPELDLKRAPREVVDQARRDAETASNTPPECSRYFANGEIYLVLFAASCREDGEYIKEADSRVLVAYRPNGELVARLHWVPRKGEAEVVPPFRTRAIGR